MQYLLHSELLKDYRDDSEHFIFLFLTVNAPVRGYKIKVGHLSNKPLLSPFIIFPSLYR